MIVGLMTSASANLNNAPDRADVAPEYRVAVGVLFNLGLLEGFTDGTFRADTTVRRSEMTKLIFEMMNGTTTAPPLRPTVFPDVYEGSGAWWARGYIAWAHGEGIVVGYPDGNFRPNQPVSIVEAATMLLRALGYGAMGEYVGTDWAQSASNDALALGIFNADIVDGFEVRDGAERQVAAQMVFNTMFVERVRHIGALDIYQGLGTYFGTRFGLTNINHFAAPVNEDPVILDGFATAGVVSFLELDGTATTDTALIGLNYAPATVEVARVVDVYASGGTIFFLDILSTDVAVTGGTPGTDLVRQLGINNANTMAPNLRGQNVIVFDNYVLTTDEVSVAPITGAMSSATLFDADITLMQRSPQVWVFFEGADVDGRDAFRTMVYTSRTVEDISAVAGNQVWIGDQLVSRNIVTLDGLTWAELTADETDTTVPPAPYGTWANVVRTAGGFTLTPVETVSGLITAVSTDVDGNITVRFAGSTTFVSYVPGVQPTLTADIGQFSERLFSIDNAASIFTNWVAAGIPNPNITQWTAHINAATGNIIAIEPWTPDFSTAELVMVTASGWDATAGTGTASFMRTNGQSSGNVAAVPNAPPMTPPAGMEARMSGLLGRVAWAVRIDGVYYLDLLTPANLPADNTVQISPAGLLGGGAGGNIFFGNANDNTIFEATLGGGVTQYRSLSAGSRFIMSNGGTSVFPNAPAGQAGTSATFTDVIFTLDAATLEIVETVFVVTVALGQDSPAW